MKKNNIRKICLMLTTIQMLTCAAGLGINSINNSKRNTANSKNNYDVIDSSEYLDENGMKRETIEISPIISYYMEPVTSTKNHIVNGEVVSEEVTTYVQRTIYTAPSCATRVEGTGEDMRCFIDYGMRPVQSKKISDNNVEDVITYSYGLIYLEQEEESNSLKLHR